LTRLSVCCFTINSAASLEQWASAAREYADEILLAVDSSSDDGTDEIARRVADRVFLVEHPSADPNSTRADWLFRQPTSDWVLQLDDDEIMGSEFAANVSRLLAATEPTHYYFKRRWIVRQEEGGLGWLSDLPWGCDLCLRLFRNIGSLFWRPLGLHVPITVLGEGRLVGPTEGSLYHLDLLWRSREQRERKVRDLYRGACADYYLFEERLAADSVALVDDPSVIDFAETTLARRQAADASLGKGGSPARSGLTAAVSLAEMVASARRNTLDVTRYGVEFLAHDTPRLMRQKSTHRVHLAVKNTSDGAWDTGSARGPVHISYHWWTASGEETTHDGARSPLPQTVGPDETAAVTAYVLAPSQPGKYVLEWDVVQENVCWFGLRAAPTLRLDVEVTGSEGTSS
jgi:hypothetical protein